MIPMLLRIRGIDHNGERFSLWLPLFLIYLILLPLLVLLFPIILLAEFLMWLFGKRVPVLQVYFSIFRIMICLSGLEFEMESFNKNLFIKLK